MELQDMILVSVDDHLIEPENMFVKHISPRFKDRAPTVMRGSNGAHHWQIEGQRAPGLGLNAVAGATRLIKREIDANAHRALLDELAAELG